MTRDEFTARIAQRADYHESIGDPRVAGVLRLVLADLEDLDGLTDTQPDRLISLDEAADRMSCEVRWLRETRPPYVVAISPKQLRVSEKKLAAWLRRS